MPHISSSVSHPRSHKAPSARALIHQLHVSDSSSEAGSYSGRSHRGGSTSSLAMGRSPSISSISAGRLSSASMDPDCFICGLPAHAKCSCEHEAITRYVEDAERKHSAIMDDLRQWVTTAARNTIQSRFRALESQHRAQHSNYISSSPPTASNYSHADRMLRQGTNEAWKIALESYPTVLDDWYAELRRRLASGWGLPRTERSNESYDEYSPDEEEPPSSSRRNHHSRRSHDNSYDQDISERMVDLSIGDRRRDRERERSKHYHSSSHSSSKYRTHREPITIRTPDEDRHRHRRSEW